MDEKSKNLQTLTLSALPEWLFVVFDIRIYFTIPLNMVYSPLSLQTLTHTMSHNERESFWAATSYCLFFVELQYQISIFGSENIRNAICASNTQILHFKLDENYSFAQITVYYNVDC